MQPGEQQAAAAAAPSVAPIRIKGPLMQTRKLSLELPNGTGYTVRVICCVLVVFLTELCLSHYIYRLIKSEMRADYVSKSEFRQMFHNEMQSDAGRQLIQRLLQDSRTMFDERESPIKKRSVPPLIDDDDEANGLGTSADEPHVEFFNPELRSALEAKDEIVRRQTGQKGAAPGGDSWIWLTSYSRIPEKALEGYCKKVHQFCPPGRPGPLGPPGIPGPKGDRGDKGFPGIPGQMGTRGLPGQPGEKGDQGRPGLDGRDGIPGEPGLDGIPGRNGHDGIPGINGLPGLPGRDGINGTNGKMGHQGPQGPPGPQGPRGLSGPRGRPGRPGSHGTPGIPGITTYKVKGANNTPGELLIPPSIAGSQSTPMGPIVVHEGENVRLHCSATGVPSPQVSWQRLVNRPINRGAWQDVAVSGHTLNITRVNRDHMGLYLCIANNGIPPQANQTFNLEVYFPPLVRTVNQMVGVVNGSTAVLECETEAFPEPIRYWERNDGRLLENGDKFRIETSAMKDGYKSVMRLNITNVHGSDFMHLYHCVSKNELQTTRGEFTIYEIDPWKTPPRLPLSEGGKIYGVLPPDKVSLEDLCGPPIQCPECQEKDPKCSAGGVSLIDLISRWDIRQFGDKKYPGIGNRTTDCVLYAVGKPVYHRFTDEIFGCWMRDSYSDKDVNKFWVTREADPTHLYQYDNKTMFRRDTFSRKYLLNQKFGGNAHIVYNGSFYYNVKQSNKIMKYSFVDGHTVQLELPFPYENGSRLLYAGQYNFMDFSVDDNGLWVIFPVPQSNNTAVMKVDAKLMQPEYIWNVSINHQKVGEMFIVCGVLYAVDSVTERNTKIRFALDLYNNKLLDVNLLFSNPFRRTTMLGYNHRNKELFSWDKGNQLTYPVRYHEIGYNYTSKEEKSDAGETAPIAEMQTGFGIF